MKWLFVLIVIAVGLAASGLEAAARCIEANKADEEALGTLDRQTFSDAAGRPEQAFILTLSAATCLVGADEDDNAGNVSKIHLFSTDDALIQRIEALLGKEVRVRGTAFGALTVHHHAPVVMDVVAIDAVVPGGGSEESGTILEPSGDPKPSYARDRDPTARQLIETWRASNEFMPSKQVGAERFEIIDRRVAWGKFGRAFLQFRILPPKGEARDFASARCPGRTTPVELQVYYQFSKHLGAWVPQGSRGDSSDDLCAEKSDKAFWTAEQIEKLLNPPPLPVPPKLSAGDVRTPEPGSQERTAIMDALRPRYETAFGKPIVFKVETLRVAADFAFAVVHPQRPDGSPIEKRVWDQSLGDGCFQDRLSASHEYWMQKRGGVWAIGLQNNMCADDSISDQGDLIGAPAQLVGKAEWPEREFMPEPE